MPFAAGGPTDIPARLLAEELGKALPQRPVVDNRTGAGVVVGTDVVAKAPKDGHTLLYTTISHAALRAMFPACPSIRWPTSQPVALVGVIPMLLMANKDLPVNSLQDLIRLYRDNPGKYDYGSSGNGTALHLAAELFLRQAGGLKVSHVPYRGSAAAMPDLLNGTTTMMLDVANNTLPYVQRGEVKGLAVSSERRLPQLPDVPTFREAGLPDYEAYTWHMVLAPKGTPEPVVRQINAAINGVLANQAVQKRLEDLAMQVRADSTPESAAGGCRPRWPSGNRSSARPASSPTDALPPCRRDPNADAASVGAVRERHRAPAHAGEGRTSALGPKCAGRALRSGAAQRPHGTTVVLQGCNGSGLSSPVHDGHAAFHKARHVRSREAAVLQAEDPAVELPARPRRTATPRLRAGCQTSHHLLAACLAPRASPFRRTRQSRQHRDERMEAFERWRASLGPEAGEGEHILREPASCRAWTSHPH